MGGNESPPIPVEHETVSAAALVLVEQVKARGLVEADDADEHRVAAEGHLSRSYQCRA
jgi:hypothetical protein